MSTPTKVYDKYASLLNYKESVDTLLLPAVSIGWIPDSHKRRVQAYEILTAYYDCYSRDYRQSPESGDTGDNDDVVEFGDPGWLCDKIASKLLGGDIDVGIPVPLIYDDPKELAKQLAAGNIAPELKTQLTERLKVSIEVNSLISEREKYFKYWFTENMIYTKIAENEIVCSYLGDCVYFVYWDEVDSFPKLMTYDPGYCFPYYDINDLSWEDKTTEVKDRFIVAWEEYENPDDDNSQLLIFRDVYELRKNGNEYECWRKHGYYKHDSSSTTSVLGLDDVALIDPKAANWKKLDIDFIPFVWVPNQQMQGMVFGRSNLHKLLPLFDAIQNSYTDLGINSDHLGGGTVFASGKDIKLKKSSSTGLPIPVKIQAGSVYYLGEDGEAHLLDNSKLQDPLLKTIEQYEKKLVQLSEITEVVAGKISSQTAFSGVALKVLLQPLIDKIMPMRQQRQQHYSMLFYYVQRLFQIYGSQEQKSLFTDPLYDIYLLFGDIIPSDRNTEMDYYLKLGQVVDDETLLTIMKHDGFEFDVDTVMERLQLKKEEEARNATALLQYNRDQDTGVSDNAEEE